jgi:hypothetical protein
MHRVIRVLVAAAAVVAASTYVFDREPVRGIDLHSRLLSSEALPTEMMNACTWDTAVPERAALQRQGGAAQAAMGDPAVAQRMPSTRCTTRSW